MATLAAAPAPVTTTPAAAGGFDWGSLVSSTVPALVAARRQDQVMKLNIQREAKGLKPLDVENYQPGVKVGIDRGTRNMILAGIAFTVLVIGGVAYATRH